MKSMCHEARRNSPSVADCRPTSSCIRTTSRIASSSTARSSSASRRPAAARSRARAALAGAAGCRRGRRGTGARCAASWRRGPRRVALRSRSWTPSHAATAPSTAAGTASSPAFPPSSAPNRIGASRRRVIAAMPAAAPTASATVGETSNQITANVAERDAEEHRREHRPAAEAATEAEGVRDRLRDQQDQHDPRRVLGHEAGDRGLAREQHVLRVGPQHVGELREQADRDPPPSSNTGMPRRGARVAIDASRSRRTPVTTSAAAMPTTMARAGRARRCPRRPAGRGR